MTTRRCLRCYRSRPEADLRRSGSGWYCEPRCSPLVPCLRCGRLLPEADAVRDRERAGWYHPECEGPWCYSGQRHDALVALRQGVLVRGEGGWWLQPQREICGVARQICTSGVMASLVRRGLVVRVRDRVLLAPWLAEEDRKA